MGVEFLADGRSDGQVDVTKLIVAFRHYANAPEKNFVRLWNRNWNAFVNKVGKTLFGPNGNGLTFWSLIFI